MLRILICVIGSHVESHEKRAACEEGPVLERNGNGSASGDWSEEGPGLPENDEYSEASGSQGRCRRFRSLLWLACSDSGLPKLPLLMNLGQLKLETDGHMLLQI